MIASAKIGVAAVVSALMMLALVSPAAHAATFEISPDDDLSVLDSLSPGDEVILSDGTFAISSSLWIEVLGTEAEPVVVRAKNAGKAILQAAPNEEAEYPNPLVRVRESAFVSLQGIVVQGDASWTTEEGQYYGILVENSSDISITKSEILETGRHAVYLSGDNARVTIERTRIHDTFSGFGLYVGCSDASCWTSELTLHNNWIHDIGGEGSIGVYLSHGTQGAVLTDNVIYAISQQGMFLGSTENGATNVVERNAIWSTTSSGIQVEGPATLRNNLIFNIEGRGIRTRDPERESGTFGDLIITSNTVVDTTDWAAELDGWEAAWQDGSGDLVLANNAFCNPIGYGVQVELGGEDTALPEAPGIVTQNVVCGVVEGLDHLNGEVTPGGGFLDFLDAEGWSFYPGKGSVLLDVAATSADAWLPETDFNGFARPVDRPDVGAYERDTATNPGWPVQEGFKEFDLVVTNPQKFVGGCCDGEDEAETKGTQALLLLPFLGMGALARRRRSSRAR